MCVCVGVQALNCQCLRACIYVCVWCECRFMDLEIVRNARQGLCSHNRAVACINVGDRQNCCRSPLLCSRYKSYTNVVGKVCGQNLQTQTCTRAAHIRKMTHLIHIHIHHAHVDQMHNTVTLIPHVSHACSSRVCARYA